MTDPTQISELRGAALAQAVAEYITAHPEEWDQNEWGYKYDCYTTACFAGTSVLLTGSFGFEHGVLIPIEDRFKEWRDGWYWTVSDAAQELLQLGTRALFYWNPQSEYETEIGFEEEYDEDTDEFTSAPEAPLDYKLRSLWARVSEEYPGQINIPEEYV